ncbi:MAG: ompA family protein [Rhizobium sp.]|nr:ompA family protein [Rhizobium sp.]
MAFKNKLLATAAIPLIALMGMTPVSAAGLVYPTVPTHAEPLVVKVQSDEDELRKQKRQERQERREKRQDQNNNAGDQNDQDNGNNKRRNKQNNDNAAQDDSGEVQQPRRKKQNQQADDQQMQQNDQEEVQPRRKKNNADAQMQQDDGNQVQQDDSGEVEQPRRKKQNQQADDQQMQQDDSGEAKPRRKKQNDNAAADQNQPSDEELKNAIEKNNRKVRKQNDTANEDNAGQAQQDDSGDVEPRRKKQNQDQAEQPSDNNDGSIEKIETPRKKKQDQADDGQSRDKVKADTPEKIKENKAIAADPSKTTDTVVLPVENGAAVLDSDKDADNRGGDKSRERRKREREEVEPVRVPKSDKDAQAGFREDKDPVRVRPVLEEKGERLTGFKGYDDVGGRRVGKNDSDNRFIINIDGRIVIRGDNDTRIARRGERRFERLADGRIREIVISSNGDRVVTVRNRYGEIIRRSRIDRNDREVVIFFSPDLDRGRERLFLRDPGASLPPMRLRIPVRDYIIDVSGDKNRDYEEFLDQPPVEPVERVYSVDEVKYSARIRDKMRRIDLDTITFDTGSAEISMNQASSLKQVGGAIKQILDNDPGETFIIEGHTDAIGSDESNLVLSDSRAESVADVLSDMFDIPPENLVTQGYGERFLKIDTDAPERENRRVTIRRITPLVRPLASAEEQ